LKVLDQQVTTNGLQLTLSAPASSRQTFLLRENESGLNLRTGDAELAPPQNGLRKVTVTFPVAADVDGYITKTVTFSW
jgi:hypothetical protein